MAINIRRRKVVIARSRKLGHCVCNPKQGCPCDTLKDHNVCPCAGEKMPVKSGAIALTRHVRKAGCASKIGQADLLRILGALPPVTDPNVLLGTAAGDDAGIYRLDDGRALVQTVDVFTPCVDDAHLFGQIAAANSLSDVYAMGGRPITALSIVGFPIDELDGRVMEELLRGGMEKLAEADCALIGGHSINDEEIKCGFAVTGLIETGAVVDRASARPGDVLVLTKPLGTGMVSFAAQIGRIRPECLAEVGASMAALNRDGAELMVAHGASACTDITGFGLAGHLVEMVRGAGLCAEIDLPALPVFGAVAGCLEHEILGGAIERNQEYSLAWVEVRDERAQGQLPILFDPQTSGGLLIALAPERAEDFLAAMGERGHGAAAAIGRVRAAQAGEEGRLIVRGQRLENFLGDREVVLEKSAAAPAASVEDPPPAEEIELSCCASPPVFDEEQATMVPTEDQDQDQDQDRAGEGGPQAGGLFLEFMKAASKPGLLDQRTKKFVAIALSIVRHCEPCLRSHLKGALAMGITKAEMDEAADLAIEFAGCPALMFYREVCAELGIR